MNISGLTSKDMPSNVVQEKEPKTKSIGKKGDVVEGVVKNVSDKITIDFNGREVEFPATTVQNAKEGDKVKFQIMDVSNERIVLKALGNAGEDAGTQVAFTTVETSSTTDILEQETSEKEVVSETNNHTKNTTTEDIRVISNADSGVYVSVEEYTLEAFDRLLEALSDKKILIQSAIDGQLERIDKVKEAIEKSAIAGRLPAGISSALAEYFVRYDIPVTEENLQNLSAGIAQMNSFTNIDNKAACYILKHELNITAENIYNATFSNMSVNENVDMYAFENVKTQIMNIVGNAGYQWNDGMESNAKFLFANDIPINEETLQKHQMIFKLKDEADSRAKYLELMVKEQAEGGKANQAVFVIDELQDESQNIEAIRNHIGQITTEDIHDVIAGRGLITIKQLYSVHLKRVNNEADFGQRENNGNGSRQEQAVDYSSEIKVKRQLEEIRLSMTLQAARTLKATGIDIETTELSRLVDELRNIEKEQYQKELSGYGSLTDAELDTVVVTEQYRREIAFAPSYMLNEFVRTGMRENISTYAETASVMTDEIKRAQSSYEQLMTTPRKDMGDSITKAFRNIDALLENSNIDVTNENRRVVKILAHNQIEITESNVNMMKDYDARIEKLLENLKPHTTLEIIRQGINPLEIPLEELERHVEIINNGSFENEDGYESSHSRFLWKLEKENKISENERESYIGICRLIHQISKHDRAAIGAVVNSGVEFTLNNLLTATRSKDKMIDAGINDSFGENVSKIDTRQIENQINAGYTTFNDRIIEKLADSITPSKLYEITQGDISKLMDMPLEKMFDEIVAAEENQTIEDEYMEYLAKTVRETAKDTESIRYVKSYGIEPTIYNINAAKNLLNNKGGAISRLLEESEDSAEKNELSDECEKLIESMTDEQAMQKQYEKVTAAARNLYESGEKGMIDIARLQSLRIMEGELKITSHMAKKHSYEIPVLTKQGVTSINLTIINGTKEKNEISIRMESQKYGTITCELAIKKSNVQALLVTSTSRDDGTMAEMICGSVTKNEFNLVSFNSVVIAGKKPYIPPEEADSRENSNQLANMYILAKDIVKGLSDMIKEEQI